MDEKRHISTKDYKRYEIAKPEEPPPKKEVVMVENLPDHTNLYLTIIAGVAVILSIVIIIGFILFRTYIDPYPSCSFTMKAYDRTKCLNDLAIKTKDVNPCFYMGDDEKDMCVVAVSLSKTNTDSKTDKKTSVTEANTNNVKKSNIPVVILQPKLDLSISWSKRVENSWVGSRVVRQVKVTNNDKVPAYNVDVRCDAYDSFNNVISSDSSALWYENIYPKESKTGNINYLGAEEKRIVKENCEITSYSLKP